MFQWQVQDKTRQDKTKTIIPKRAKWDLLIGIRTWPVLDKSSAGFWNTVWSPQQKLKIMLVTLILHHDQDSIVSAVYVLYMCFWKQIKHKFLACNCLKSLAVTCTSAGLCSWHFSREVRTLRSFFFFSFFNSLNYRKKINETVSKLPGSCSKVARASLL